MHVVSAHTRASVRVLIAGRTTGEDNRTGVKWGAGIADVGPVLVVSVVVPVGTICHRKWSAGLERCNAGELPPAEGIFRPAGLGTRNRPQISNGQTLRAVVVTQPAIELQSSEHYRNRRQITVGRSLHIYITYAVAGAVDELRPRIRSRDLEAAPEAAIQTRLQGMIRRVPLAGFQNDRSIVRMEALRAGGQPRIPVGFGRQSVAFRTHIGEFQKHALRQLALKPKGPPFGVRVTQVLVERHLGVSQTGSGRRCGQLLQPVGRPAPGIRHRYLNVYRVGSRG